MADGNDTADLVGPGAEAGAGAESGVPAGPPAGAQGPPQTGGPILAALARNRQGPQVSAPGPGNQASGMNLINQAVGYIQMALPMLPQGSPIHRDALRAASTLSRHANQGQPTAGVQLTQARDLIRNIARSGMLQQIMQQMGGRQAPAQGGSPMQAAAAPPMPSTPMPGA